MKPDAHWIQRAQDAAERQLPGQHVDIELLPPHGSQRRYARVQTHTHDANDPKSLILMLLPEPDAAPAEAGSIRVDRASDEPFIDVARWLEAAQVPAPRVLATDDRARAIWLNDLGRTDLDQALAQGPLTQPDAYRKALNLLQQFQNAAAHPARPAFTDDRALDAKLLRWELEHYVEWRFERRLKLHLNAEERDALNTAFDYIVGALTSLPQTTVHRDFQSHNIMVLDSGELAIIDFQDALQGPIVYDAVALLRDSYIELPAPLLQQLVQQWAENASADAAVNPRTLVQAFHIQTIQRKLKDTGRFDLFDIQQGKSGFLQYQPASVRYVQHAIQQLSAIEELHGLKRVLQQHEPLWNTP